MPELIDTLTADAIELLKQLIQTPSFSREEDQTADQIFRFLTFHGARPQRDANNVWAVSRALRPRPAHRAAQLPPRHGEARRQPGPTTRSGPPWRATGSPASAATTPGLRR